jgi:hypothetical protein
MKRFRASVLALDTAKPSPSAPIFRGLWWTLRFGLRIANGLGQHLAKLGFGLWRFAREGFCPCGHFEYMGTPQSVLNPRLELTRLPPKSESTSVLRPPTDAAVPSRWIGELDKTGSFAGTNPAIAAYRA